MGLTAGRARGGADACGWHSAEACAALEVVGIPHLNDVRIAACPAYFAELVNVGLHDARDLQGANQLIDVPVNVSNCKRAPHAGC
eukprot:4707681-Pyramimonas_sp.AAC.1